MADDFIEGDEFDPEVAQAAEDKRTLALNEKDARVEAYMRQTQRCYRAVFQTGTATEDDIDFVLRDLAWFSKVDTHYFPDARLQDVFAGRKQVVQRIAEYTGLSLETLMRRYAENQ